LCGWFLPTAKNAPAREFYPLHGFELQQNNVKGSLWAFDLQKAQIACPEWIKLTP
jgi:predicted enzyme involved in methoxymalonyl-ACP biosynthesis